MFRLAPTVPGMSTMIPTRPGPTTSPRLLSGPLAATFLAEFSSLTSFFLLLSAMPMLAVAAGASSSGAGLITGSLLLGTVAAEAVATIVIRRFGYRTILAAGAVLLGAPALALLIRQPPAMLVGVSLVRGFGFGLCGVVTGALTATLLPPDRRGEGLGLLGLVSGVPAVLALPAGVWLAGHHLAVPAAILAAAAGLLPLAVLRWLPGGHAGQSTGQSSGQSTDQGTAQPGRPAAAAPRRRARTALRLPLIFAAVTVAAGVVDSFLPLVKGVPSNLSSAVLLVSAVTATLTRWQAGRFGDRHGHARLLIPAIVVSALGLAATALLGWPVLIFAGMALFGAGLGGLESATFALLIGQVPEAQASARWNLAYDAGYGAGPAVFGLVCTRTGYPVAFALTGVLVLAVLPLAGRERASVRRAALTENR